MAIFHSTTKIIGRASGRSAVAAAAYRAGVMLTNEWDGITHDYTRKRGIEYSEIMLPVNAPEEYKNRDILWNAVEQIEKRKDAQLAREIELGLPAELDRQSQIDLLRDYINENFIKKGMCADFSLHDKGDGNPHAHIMLTMRSIDENGNWMGKQKKEYILDKHGNKQYDKVKKTYKCKSVPTNDWNNIENVTQWREAWANNCNREFEKFCIDERVDHRSYVEQGIERKPTVHLGTAAHQLEKRGIQTDRGNINREVQSVNRANLELEEMKDKLVAAFAEQYEIETAPIGAELTAAVEEPTTRPKEERPKPQTRYQRELELKKTVEAYNFLKQHGINSFSEMDETLQSLWNEISSTKSGKQENTDTIVINKTTRQQKEKQLGGTVEAYNFIKKNGLSEIGNKLESLENEISETKLKISALFERKKEVVQVIDITEKYFQTKELLARQDTPINRNAFQSVRKQLMQMKFKDLPNLEALKNEREELNNSIKEFKTIKNEKEEFHKELSRVVQSDQQEPQSRGAAAPMGATAAVPIKKLSMQERMAAATAEAARRSSDQSASLKNTKDINK